MSNAIFQPFGELPSDWEYGLVEENVDYLTGPAFDSEKFNIEGRGIRLVRGINLTKGATRWHAEKTKYWDSDLDKLIKYELIESDILIGMDGSLVGKNYAYLRKDDLPALLVQRVARLRAKEYFSSKFLYFLFGTDEWLTYVETVKTSSGIPHISNGDIKSFHIPTPPLPEQQKIAKILTSVDEVIEKTQAQIDKLKDLKTGMMQELLTNGIGHTEFKDSPVGRIPAEWEVVKFKEIFSDYKYGPRFSSKDYHENGNVKTIRGTDLSKSGEISYQNVPTAKLDDDVVNLHGLHDGDLVMITTADCGATAIFRKQSIPFIASAYAIKLSPKDNIDSHFVTYFMQTSLAKKQVESFIRKGTVANLPGSDVMSITLALPPIREQRKITKILSHLDKDISLKHKKLFNISNTKKALMQDLLTGKVRVKVS